METKNLDIYDHAPIPWTRARDALAASHGPGFTFFLGTVRSWHLYRFVFHTAFGVATAEPHGASRWRFDT
jgi:hypothetical protein